MLTRVTDAKTVAALARLSRSDDGRAMLAELRMWLETAKDNLVFVKPDMVQRAQGHAEILRDIVETIEGAPALLDKLEKRHG